MMSQTGLTAGPQLTVKNCWAQTTQSCTVAPQKNTGPGLGGTAAAEDEAGRASAPETAARVARWRSFMLKRTKPCRETCENYGSYGGATPQPQRGTGACDTVSAPGCELCTASRVPHSA